jgi:hypothetical protein
MALPDMRCPGSWHLSIGGIPIPPVPTGEQHMTEVHRCFCELIEEQWADPLRDPDSEEWNHMFKCERDVELTHYVAPSRRTPSVVGTAGGFHVEQERGWAPCMVGNEGPQVVERRGPMPPTVGSAGGLTVTLGVKDGVAIVVLALLVFTLFATPLPRPPAGGEGGATLTSAESGATSFSAPPKPTTTATMAASSTRMPSTDTR